MRRLWWRLRLLLLARRALPADPAAARVRAATLAALRRRAAH